MRLKVKLLLLALPVFLIAQSGIGTQLGNFIRLGEVEKLKMHFDQSVEIITPENEGVFSQNQGEQVLKAFFNKYPCSEYTVDHKGNSAGGASFIIGTYKSGKQEFRSSIFLKQVDEKFLIQEMTFEE